MGVLAAAAVVGAATVYASNKASKSANDAINASKEPGYLQDAEQTATDIGKTIANKPYESYGGQRVANLSANEKTASDMASPDSENAQLAKSNFQQASNLAGQTTSFDPNSYKSFFNPYVKEALDPVAREANLSYASNLNQIRSNSSQIGAFGGDRQAISEGVAAGKHEQNISDIYGKGYKDAFDTSMNQAIQTWGADNARKLNASQALAAVGGDITQMNSQQISDLIRTGQSQRLLDQAQLDVNYGDFIEKRDWDKNNLQPLLQSISASKGGNVTTTYSGQKPDTLGQVLGAAATIAGYYGSTPKSSGQPSANLSAGTAYSDYSSMGTSAGGVPA
jgi:hypothetical protein